MLAQNKPLDLGAGVKHGGRFFRQAEWSVYFEADPDTLYMDDIYVIDTIQACGAKLIWITPKMREEWRHKEQSPQHVL